MGPKDDDPATRCGTDDGQSRGAPLARHRSWGDWGNAPSLRESRRRRRGKADVVSGSKIELGHGVACGEGCLPGGCARATTPHELHLDAGWEAPGHGVRETPGVGGMGRRPWGEL